MSSKSSTRKRLTSSLQLRLFLTCWLVFVMHFASDIVREHYLSFSLAEDYSFRMDKYLGLHVDIFDTPGHGAHIGNNPGVSMLGAIPYLLFRPVIDPIVARVNAKRAASGEPITAIYDDPRPSRVEFFRKTRERGLDIQFGLAAGVIQAFFMAPLSALAAVVMLRLLYALGLSARTALLGAFLYALGTPIFFRTAFINQNLFIAHLLLFGFVALWRPSGFPAWRTGTACFFAGVMGGYSLLSDYSGGVVLAFLGAYAVWLAWSTGGWLPARRSALSYAAGAAGPIALMLFYQWRAFGSPWYPGQHYMPAVDWIDVGYQGVGLPKWELFSLLMVDTRFGLLTSCPLLVLSLVGFATAVRRRTWLPRREAIFLFGFSAAFVIFFSAVQYTRLQWVTGIRYIVPVIPALFLLAFVSLLRLPTWLRYPIIVLAFAEAWALSMARATAISDSLARVFLGGFQLPWMNVLARMAPQYFPFMDRESSPLPLFLLCGALIYGLWRYPQAEALESHDTMDSGRQQIKVAVI
jgi:hypothetical protein